MERTSGNSMIDNKIGFALYCERKATEEEKHEKQRLIKMSSLPPHDMALHRDCVTQWIASLIVHSAMMTMTKIPDNRKAELTVAFIHLHYNWNPLTKTCKATTAKKKRADTYCILFWGGAAGQAPTQKEFKASRFTSRGSREREYGIGHMCH